MAFFNLIFHLLALQSISHAYICGENGYITNADYISVADNSTVSVETCRDWCHDTNEKKGFAPLKCQSYAHDSASNLCIIYPYTLNSTTQYSLGFRANSSSTISFFSEHCFKYKQTCRSSRNINMINNSGFNISRTLIGPWLPQPRGQVRMVRFGANGNAVLLKGHSSIMQYRGLCPGRDYKISIDYKIVNPNPNVTFIAAVSITMGDCAFTQSYDSTSAIFGKLHHWECSLRRTTGNAQVITYDNLNLAAYSNYTGLLTYFANPKLLEITPPYSLETIGPSLVTNGGFETDGYAPWKPKGHGQNKTFEVVSPGLPAKTGTSKSNYKFRFTGLGRPDGYYYEALASFTMQQRLNAPLKREKLYVLMLEYQLFESEGLFVKIGNVAFDNSAYFFPLHYFMNSTRVLSRIFGGSGKVESLSIRVNARSESAPRVNLTILLDNISIHELASK